jgi:hypothetical protein
LISAILSEGKFPGALFERRPVELPASTPNATIENGLAEEIKMLNWFLISDPKKPGSMSFALVQNEEQEKTLRDNVAQQNLICGPTRPVGPTDAFWRFQDLIRR